jgi:Ca-activated chloride channel family protein
MSFGAPGYLSLLSLAALAAGIVVWWMAWRAGARGRFGLASAAWRIAAYAPPIALIAALAITVLAAARPQASSQDVLVDQRGVDVVIVLDVSNSMLADDVQPTRLGLAQAQLDALLERMHGNRVGLVIFARQAFARSPLTADMQALRIIVDSADSDRALLLPGSDLGVAVQGAQRILQGGTADTKAMLIVSDGEDRAPGLSDAVAAAHNAGTLVYTAGVGTAEGSPIRDVNPGTGAEVIRVDSTGNPVVTRLDATALEQIANQGGGRYIALSGDGPPLTGLAAELKSLRQTAFGTKQSSAPIDRFQIVAAVALLLLVAELAWPALRLRRVWVRSAAKLWPLAGAGLLVGAICSAGVASVNRHGNNDYSSGDFDGAIAQYRTAEAMAPARGEIYHNAGNAFDRKGEYDKAIDETLRALPAQQDLVSRLEYALGNHYVGATKLTDALEAYKRALLADPGDADAKHNLEVVTARLTPSPSPTATPRSASTSEPNSTAIPAATPGDTQSGTPAATPGPGDGSSTPADGEGQPSRGELQQELAKALAGNDKQFTADEANHVLDLLDAENQRAIEGTGNNVAAGPPDY